jgi:histone-lysine N-methyltransferase EZH2
LYNVFSVQVGGKAGGTSVTGTGSGSGAPEAAADTNRSRGAEGDPSKSGTLSPSKQPVPPGWTGAEVTYFGLLRPIYGHNCCTIAELLRTKTCQEVYDYSQQVLGDSSLGQWEGPKRLTAKKKKRNMRYIIHGAALSFAHQN